MLWSSSPSIMVQMEGPCQWKMQLLLVLKRGNRGSSNSFREADLLGEQQGCMYLFIAGDLDWISKDSIILCACINILLLCIIVYPKQERKIISNGRLQCYCNMLGLHLSHLWNLDCFSGSTFWRIVITLLTVSCKYFWAFIFSILLVQGSSYLLW